MGVLPKIRISWRMSPEEQASHYDAGLGYFIQNWKVPKTAGCYMVRVTTQQDGLALTARFKVK